MNENTSKKREWVKNAAIIFLTVMLVLTFFSNTIMNYSLPEVSTKYVQRGSITAKVRGSGKVEAIDPYNVTVKESRVIASVAVKQGDEVEKDQVLYYLEDKESDELEKAEKELEDLELAYMKGLFGGTVSPEIINKVASGNTDTFSSYQAKVTDMQKRLQAALDRVNECKKAVDEISLQKDIFNNNAGISTISEELAKAQAETDLSNAQTAFNNYKSQKIAEIEEEIVELTKQKSDLEELINKATQLSDDTETNGEVSNEVSLRKQAVKEKIKKIIALAIQGSDGLSENATESKVKKWYDALNWSVLSAEQQKACEAAYGEYRVAVDAYNDAVSTLGEYSAHANQQQRLEELIQEIARLNAQKAEISAIVPESNENIADAQKRLEEAARSIQIITSNNKQSDVAYLNKLAGAEAALKNAQTLYELLKTEQDELSADINAELDLSKANKDIEKKKEEIEKLKEKSMGAEIKAPVAGTVTSLSYTAGETTKPEETAAVIQVAGKGYTLSFPVTAEQARKVQVGDTAEMQNAWYYDDVQAILTAIKPDPESAGQKKLLVFDVTGSSIQAGQTLNLSVGQKSADYELTVPNSAIREDNNGKFILIVESKSGPISNRYIATRVDVEVLASDDNNTAISAGLYGYEYVITTSTAPVEAGKQVRLNES